MRCADHQVEASSTCVRCGRAMCEQCPALVGACQACQVAQLAERPPPGFFTGISPFMWAVAASIILMVVGACATGSAALQYLSQHWGR
jgi:hypothetical protein